MPDHFQQSADPVGVSGGVQLRDLHLGLGPQPSAAAGGRGRLVCGYRGQHGAGNVLIEEPAGLARVRDRVHVRRALERARARVRLRRCPRRRPPLPPGPRPAGGGLQLHGGGATGWQVWSRHAFRIRSIVTPSRRCAAAHTLRLGRPPRVRRLPDPVVVPPLRAPSTPRTHPPSSRRKSGPRPRPRGRPGPQPLLLGASCYSRRFCLVFRHQTKPSGILGQIGRVCAPRSRSRHHGSSRRAAALRRLTVPVHPSLEAMTVWSLLSGGLSLSPKRISLPHLDLSIPSRLSPFPLPSARARVREVLRNRGGRWGPRRDSRPRPGAPAPVRRT